MSIFDNPYSYTTNEFLIWEVLVRNDFEGFLEGNWDNVEKDYIKEGFFGIDFAKSTSPNTWTLGFPTLEHYKNQWLLDSKEFRNNDFAVDPRQRLYESCQLTDIQISGTTAMVHKLFAGDIPINGGVSLDLNWRSLFLLRLHEERWRIAGFCGYIYTQSL